MDRDRTTRHPLRKAATGGEACYFLGAASGEEEAVNQWHSGIYNAPTPPEEVLVPGDDKRALIHHGGERLEWQVVG